MATKHTDTTDDETHWHPATIRRRLPNATELTDGQLRALVAAIRNPEAGLRTVAQSADVEHGTLTNVLWRYKVGGFDAQGDHHPELNRGSSAFQDRTLKQRAAIHWHAKHPEGMDTLTYQQTAEHCKQETGVNIHWSSMHGAKKKYPELIQRRRRWVKNHTDDGVVRLTEADAPSKPARGRGSDEPIRVVLEEAGIDDLPDHNLDDLPTSREAQEAGREKGLKRAHEITRAGGSAETTSETSEAAAGESGAEPEREADAGGGADADGGDGAEMTERAVGNAGYKGPSSGIDLTSGHAPSLLVERASDEMEDEVADELARIRDEEGDFGENAYERPVEIDDRDDLESELRRLRMIVASQGKMLKALRETLDNLSVTVEVGTDTPEAGDAE